MDIQSKLDITDIFSLQEYFKFYDSFHFQIEPIINSVRNKMGIGQSDEWRAWNNYCKKTFGFDFTDPKYTWSNAQKIYDAKHKYRNDIILFVWERFCKKMSIDDMIERSVEKHSYYIFDLDYICSEYENWLNENGVG